MWCAKPGMQNRCAKPDVQNLVPKTQCAKPSVQNPPYKSCCAKAIPQNPNAEPGAWARPGDSSGTAGSVQKGEAKLKTLLRTPRSGSGGEDERVLCEHRKRKRTSGSSPCGATEAFKAWGCSGCALWKQKCGVRQIAMGEGVRRSGEAGAGELQGQNQVFLGEK